jgi:hypothetical protein
MNDLDASCLRGVDTAERYHRGDCKETDQKRVRGFQYMDILDGDARMEKETKTLPVAVTFHLWLVKWAA